MVEQFASGRDDHGEEFQDGAVNARGNVDLVGGMLDVLDRGRPGARALHYSGKRAGIALAGRGRGVVTLNL